MICLAIGGIFKKYINTLRAIISECILMRNYFVIFHPELKNYWEVFVRSEYHTAAVTYPMLYISVAMDPTLLKSKSLMQK